MAKAWLAPGGPNHLLYGGWNRFVGLGPGPSSTELFNGIGLLTSALVIAGLVLFRDRAVVRLWGLVSLSVMLLSYQWPGGYSLWRFVYACFPGATAIRAVSRLSVYLLLPASIVLASIVDRIGTRAASIAAIACMLAVGLEQAGTLQDVKDYSKAQLRARIAMVANAVRPECAAFLFSWGQLLFEQPLPRPPAVHILGMWAELATGVPTLNGYSGSIPPQWPLRDVRVTNDADRKRVLENVELWMQLHPHDFGNVCWVLPEPPGSMNVSLQVIQHPH